MVEKYQKLTILHVDDTVKEIVQAFVAEYDVDSIIEIEQGLEVYAPHEEYQSIVDHLKAIPLLSQLTYETTEHEMKNWNEEWESQFDPIIINGLHVRATFHSKDEAAREEIVIAPKMAFGTGHHATTYMMLEKMQSLQIQDQRVLDYGCGTGILSIYAAMKGAVHVDGIDIQAEAEDNFIEHIQLNNLLEHSLKFILGTLRQVSEKYDLILANINRAVLMEKADDLNQLCHNGTSLLLSGILENDKDMVINRYEESGFNLISSQQREDWILLHLTKSA